MKIGQDVARLLDRATGRTVRTIGLPAPAQYVRVLSTGPRDTYLGGVGIVVQVDRLVGESAPPGLPDPVRVFQTPAGAYVLGAGEGYAVVQHGSGAIDLIDLVRGKTVWTVKVADEATRSLVGKDAVVVVGKCVHAFERATGAARVQVNIGRPGRKIGFDREFLVLHDEQRVSRVSVGAPPARVQLTSSRQETLPTLRIDGTGALEIVSGPSSPRAAGLLTPLHPSCENGQVWLDGGRLFTATRPTGREPSQVSCLEIPAAVRHTLWETFAHVCPPGRR